MAQVGRIGTFSGVVIRTMRGVLACAAVYFLANSTASDISTFTRAMKNVVMPIHMFHVIIIILYDIRCLMRPRTHNGFIYGAIIISEWLNMYMVLAVGAGSLAITMSIAWAANICPIVRDERSTCHSYWISSILSLVVWLLTVVSTLIESWAFAVEWAARNNED